MSSNESSMKKCGYCGQTAHTSTACNNGKVDIINIFGVRIDPLTADQREDDGNMQVVNGASSSTHESKSMESLKMHNIEHSCIELGYSSDGHNQDKNKGMPWTEDEHRLFLTGLQKLGKGQWRAISKHYVPSRTPTQVASHAQKFFIRMNSTEDKRKLRSSLFDMPLDEYSAAPGTSVRPPSAPLMLNQTYGVEGYSQFSNLMRIPLTNYMLGYPLSQSTENFAATVPRPLLLTNGEKCTTQEPKVESTKD